VVGRQTTVIMPRVQDSKVIQTNKAESRDIRVINHTDDHVINVYDSHKTAEIASFYYGENPVSEDEAIHRAEEYANGYVAGLKE